VFRDVNKVITRSERATLAIRANSSVVKRATGERDGELEEGREEKRLDGD
jgi:hypothetical protein